MKPLEKVKEIFDSEFRKKKNIPFIVDSKDIFDMLAKNPELKQKFDNVKFCGRSCCLPDLINLDQGLPKCNPECIVCNPALQDNVNHPKHYTKSKAECDCGRRIECIDVVRHLSFNIGNAIKYLWRCDIKGSPLEDLKKAAWYLNDEITKRENE